MKVHAKWLVFAFAISLLSTVFLHIHILLNYSHAQINLRMKNTRNDLAFQRVQVVRLVTPTQQSVKDITTTSKKAVSDTTTLKIKKSISVPKIVYPKDDPEEDMSFPPKQQKYCKRFPPGLKGPLVVNATYQPTIDEAIKAAGIHVFNGCHRPKDCRSLQKVAIVIPYKNRYNHLVTLLRHLHPILQTDRGINAVPPQELNPMKVTLSELTLNEINHQSDMSFYELTRQNVMYCIFVAEQYDDGVFNKARVMNAAFVEITTRWRRHRDPESRDFSCFIYHDVDMLVENDKNIYDCVKFPKHMSPAIDKFNYTTGYGTKYGGVTAIRKKHYQLVNGHSNRFWGWGGEDNDMEARILANNLSITSVNESIGRYKMIEHIHPWWFSPESGVGSYITKKKAASSKSRERFLEGEVKKPTDLSGVSDVKFKLIETQRHKLWTKLILDIRNHVVEKMLVHIVDINGTVFMENQDLMKSRMKEDLSKDDVIDKDFCQPTYHRFVGMTVNRTREATDTSYTKVYYSLDEAKDKCNDMKSFCRSIVEQMISRYSLRSTAFVQENYLVYKYGLAEQYNVTENHHATSTYVKICKNNPSYTQIFTPTITLRGDVQAGLSPRYFVEFHIRVFHKSNTVFSHHSQIMTSHRAVMEERFINHNIQKTWWDSLGRVQFGRTKLLNMSDEKTIELLTSDRDGSSRLIKIRTPMTGINRKPGCFVAKSSLMDEVSQQTALKMTWWFQLRARTKKMEEEFLQLELKKSLKTGEEFRKMLNDQRSTLNKYAQQQQVKQEQKKKEGYAKLNKPKTS